ncbi:GlsB/YeaQ/YmgE family stress response membrane protein [Alkalibacter rhizosphaerae]|uniref:GlsB/YeaQ/YmgE family stress response membrane protein n=1 Tax=Alkalibacter rhizosphaerae TaxID=2815577 RepID=A0A974XNK0_9FIRM|nr:GlsB/YeaQ/YmgE family stress response membrane protein [Alkalibacter rhizosphaerae]QSX09136.1 GlsB/YeaQ/YmgE family stress response membrane protein [Alkalibacter rhizosphaerae]
MGFIGWIIFGGLAGWITTLLRKDRKGGLLRNIIVGIIGANVGGFLFEQLGFAGVTGFNIWSMFVAVVGAMILLTIVNALTK